MGSEPLTSSARRRAPVARTLSVALSLALHAALLSALRGALPAGVPVAASDAELRRPPPPAIEIDLGGRAEPLPEPPAAPPAEPAKLAAAGVPRERSTRVAARGESPQRAPAGEPPEGQAPPSASAGHADAWSPLDNTGEQRLPGLSGPPIWAVPGIVGAPSAAPAPTAVAPRAVDPESARRALQKGLDDQDKSKGIDLPAAGTIASELGDVVRASTSPLFARARFAAKLGGSGRLLGVEVIQFTVGDAKMWKGIAGEIERRLAGRTFEVPPRYAAGATVFIDVVSVMQDVYGGKSDRAQRLLGVDKRPAQCRPPIPGDYPDRGLLQPTQCGPITGGTTHLVRVVSTSFSVQLLK